MVARFGAMNRPLPRHWLGRVRSAIVHAVSMASIAFTITQARVAKHVDARVRAQSEIDRLRHHVSLQEEELRIKDARMERLPAQRRPHYPPIERLAILELRAARGWSQAETARRLLVTPLTVASWTHRLDDQGPDALVQSPEPVNRFPDLVAHLVRRLKVFCPRLGSRRVARVLARAALHVSATTVRRLLRPPAKRPAKRRRPGSLREITATHPNHVCRRHGIGLRWGAIGKYGSIAVVERFIRSLKDECTRVLIAVPLSKTAFARELDHFVDWYNAARPHSRFGARTPDETYFNRFPASRRPRFEPRARWPRRSPCAEPHALIRGRPGAVVELSVGYYAGRRHLPIVTLKRVA